MADERTAPKIDQQKVAQEVSWIGARLREPSTYAGLGILLSLAGIGHGVEGSVVKDVSMIGMGIGGLIAIFLPEARRAVNGHAVALFAIAATALALAFPTPSFAAAAKAKLAVAAKAKLTTAQVQSNPLLLLQQFSVADLEAAIADAQQQPAGSLAATLGLPCWQALLPLVQSQQTNPLPSNLGVFTLIQKALDLKSGIQDLTSASGAISKINMACAPLVVDGNTTLLGLGISTGLVVGTGGISSLPAIPGLLAILPK